jgi:hypothetical protein
MKFGYIKKREHMFGYSEVVDNILKKRTLKQVRDYTALIFFSIFTLAAD